MRLIKLCTSVIAVLLCVNTNAQLKVGDQPTINQKAVALDVQGSNGQQGLWLPRVADTSITGIRALNPPNGLIIYHTTSGKILLRSNNAWVEFLTNGVQSVTAGGPQMTGPALTYNTSTTGTDFSISSVGNIATWNLPDASATARGVITTGAQTLAGAKTFGNGVTVNNGSTLNNGTTANNGLTVSGATTNTSNLTLGVTSATVPAAATDRYLSVNAAGNVTLNAISNISSVSAGGSTMTGALTYNTGTTGTDINIASSGNIITWNVPDASATARGAITTGAQSFSGVKTFGTGVTVNNGTILNNGTNANGGLTVSGATTNASNLVLGVTSATTPGVATDRYLSVNAAGNVTLNSISNVSSVTAGGSTMTGALTYNTGTAGTDFNISSSGSTITWNMPDASTTARGAVTIGAQTFGGAKTFGNGITVNNGSTLNSGTTANGGLTVSGATTSTSNLTLGVTSATTPAASTDRYLSVNASGNVTLNSISNVSSVTAGGPALTGALTYNTGTTGTDFNISSAGSIVTWNLPDASATARGAVTIGAQTFAGAKTFGNGVTVNNGTTANGGLTVTGATTNTSNLTLGVTSATTPAASTDRYLSVNAAGNVTLNSISAITSVSTGGTPMTGPALTYNTGTVGTDFNISSAGNVATWNLPSASATARGVVTTGTQTLAGVKTFSDSLTANNKLLVSGLNNIYKSNLALGVNALTPAGGSREKYLSVDTAGNVTLNAMGIVSTNSELRFKSYLREIDGAPMNMANNTPTMYTFTIAGANLSTQSSVVVTPLFQFKLGAGILYSRVRDANTIELVLNYLGNGTQPINSGTNGMYNITVIEYQ